MKSRAGAALGALLLAGCAGVGAPPDTGGDIGGAVGSAVGGALSHVPLVNTLIDSADNLRAAARERRDRRASEREAARAEGMRWEQCREHPCLYADRCADLFPDIFLPPSCPAIDAGPERARVEPPPAGPPAGGALSSSVRGHEGLRLASYRDSGDDLHIGYGHRIFISPRLADAISESDLAEAEAGARRAAGAEAWDGLGAARRGALAEMAYALGATGLARFDRMLGAVRRGDFADAAAELLDSVWARRVGARAETLARRMRTGD